MDLCSRWLVFFTMVIALAGCDQSSNVGAPKTPQNVRVPQAEPSQQRSSATKPQVAAAEDAATAEATSPGAPAAVEQSPPESGHTPSAVDPVPTPSRDAPPRPKVALSIPEPPEYIYEPQVLMSQRHADSCIVKKGEPFPDGQLSDLEGQQHSLKELLGEKATVIVFWSNSKRLGREQIQRLETEMLAPFQNTGLSVVAINISDPPEQIRDLLPADREPGFPVLLDKGAELFSKVATEGHPRTYLLDASGKVLWYDIEYSRDMVRDLANAIHVYLGGRKPGDS